MAAAALATAGLLVLGVFVTTRGDELPCDPSHAGQVITAQPPDRWHPQGIPDPHFFLVCLRGEDGTFDWMALGRGRAPGLVRR